MNNCKMYMIYTNNIHDGIQLSSIMYIILKASFYEYIYFRYFDFTICTCTILGYNIYRFLHK